MPASSADDMLLIPENTNAKKNTANTLKTFLIFILAP